jgi:glycosyltransferase involved in cell wall biosynthesis
VKISAVIITFNEERNIGEAIESVRWADEILVVDSHSEDRTIEIAESAGVKVITREWKGFADQKQFAAGAAENDWIMSLDADERVSAELTKEILELKGGGQLGAADGYSIPRLSIYMGREIRHSGWYPDRQLRLFDRRKCRWQSRVIHESIAMSPGTRTDKLAGNILHYSIRNASEHSKLVTERYAPLSARQMLVDGRKTSKTKAAVAGIAAFFRSFVLKGGMLDGFPGLCIAYFAAYNAFLKHLLLLELQQASNER